MERALRTPPAAAKHGGVIDQPLVDAGHRQHHGEEQGKPEAGPEEPPGVAADIVVGEVHDPWLIQRRPSASERAPGSSTMSPGARPAAISTMSVPRRPIWTGARHTRPPR